MPADLPEFTHLLASLAFTPALPAPPRPSPPPPSSWMGEIPLGRVGMGRKDYEEGMKSRVATVKFNLQLLRSKS